MSDIDFEVTEDDFREILAQTRAFVRNVVVPREQEIADTDVDPGRHP